MVLPPQVPHRDLGAGQLAAELGQGVGLGDVGDDGREGLAGADRVARLDVQGPDHAGDGRLHHDLALGLDQARFFDRDADWSPIHGGDAVRACRVLAASLGGGAAEQPDQSTEYCATREGGLWQHRVSPDWCAPKSRA